MAKIFGVLGIALTVLAVTAAGANAAMATLTPASHDYGTADVGTTTTPFTFSFDASCTLDLITVPFCLDPGSYPTTPTVTGDFTVTGTTCPANLGVTIYPGNSCTIDVAFKPTAGGPRTGWLTASPGYISSLRGTAPVATTFFPPPAHKKCKRRHHNSAAAAKKKCKKRN